MTPRLQLPRYGAQVSLDRASERRADTAWIEARLADERARFLLLADLKPCLAANADGTTARLRWFTRQELDALAIPLASAMFLGTDDAADRFAVALTPDVMVAEPLRAALMPLVDVRSLAVQGAMSEAELALAGQARSLAAWHAIARCCGRCGAATSPRDAGWRLVCTACGQEFYPRCDPAVIMLVTDGERCLLGHERRFPDRFYSVLAGFVEPGDDIEHAVRREVMEETGVKVGAVRYIASQPWPFPHALMIGCWAEALSTQITLDPAELEDAFWASREEVRAMLEGRDPHGRTLPGRQSMAHTLLTAFLERSI
jgi:NAD+ diphosphatase